MILSSHWVRIVLLAILLGYLVAGVSYAHFTPAWQAPDEPAHYNYVRYVAENGHLPVLTMGDYPHEYLEEIKSRRFPTDLSIDPIRYEFHQPPLYYLLASVVYWLADGSLMALRLLSLALGTGSLAVAWGLLRVVLPQRPDLALGATAFVAFLPMHLAMTSAVNNDVLAELLLTASVLGLVHYLRAPRPGHWRAVGLGILVGLGLVTKLTVFIVVPLMLVGILVGPHRGTDSGGGAGPSRGHRRVRDAVLILGVAALVLLPWLVRNHLVYGGLDLLGLSRHDRVVVGQPRTAEWLVERGCRGLLRSFGQTTFQSFWGQFGWMGVLLDSRLYMILGILSGLVAFGILLLVVQRVHIGGHRLLTMDPVPSQPWLLGLLGLWLALTLGSYLWYNVEFVQHQGRYLFPALVPLALLFAGGLAEALSRPRAWLVAGICLASGCLLIVKGLASGGPDPWAVVLLAGTGMGFILRRILVEAWDTAVHTLPYVGLFALDWICLFGFIVPALS
jgi:4-amino-4-deoxy-L-arabinose transferase-like glycosyltransferase